MCSFLFICRQHIEAHRPSFSDLNSTLQNRGPDSSRFCNINGHFFAHNLLSIAGGFSPQPFIDHVNSLVLLFNGEIYNWKELSPNASSEAESIVSLFSNKGYRAFTELDGEFAILLYDGIHDEVITITDGFGTKPLHYVIDSMGISISSLPTPLQKLTHNTPIRQQPNSIRKISLRCPTESQFYFLSSTVEFYPEPDEFSLDEWAKLFHLAVKKRLLHKNPNVKTFLPLSSGLDSGCIAAALHSMRASDVGIFSVVGSEDINVLQSRQKLMSDNDWYMIDGHQRNHSWIIDYLDSSVPSLRFDIFSGATPYNEFDMQLHDDNGSKALVMLGRFAHSKGFKVCLSGQGADELYSDYGYSGVPVAQHSSFSGVWPNNIARLFPWPSFYGSSMATYLLKEEFILGSFGIESRYPFLDRDLTLYSLRLPKALRETSYKYPLQEYLRSYDFPATTKKYGF